MCTKTMESTCKLRFCLLRRTMKVGYKARCRLRDADEACGTSHAITRKYRQLRREARQAKLLRALMVDEAKKENEEPVGAVERTDPSSALAAAAYSYPHPGSMAPANTTQYLMGIAEEDEEKEKHHTQVYSTPDTWSHIYRENVSPESVYKALDSFDESFVGFQTRDFDEAFDLMRYPE